jgi:hypothetical protein
MHPACGLITDLAQALGLSLVDVQILLNEARVPFKHHEGDDVFSRSHLIQAFKSDLIKVDKPERSAVPQYSFEEAAKRYRASLPVDGEPPY